jgi:hypothetical protein
LYKDKTKRRREKVRKLALAIVLVIVLVGSGLAGMSLTGAAPSAPTLKANGSSAPGTVFVSGSYWALGTPVDIYMDPVSDPPDPSDVAHHVAVAWPSGSMRNFSTSFVVGPTSLGYHKIIAVQDSVEQTASFCIKSTQPLDDWTAQVLEDIQNDPEIGLAEIKSEVSNIEDALCHVAIINTYCSNETWTGGGDHTRCIWFCHQIRHVSLTILPSAVDFGDSVWVEIHFPSTDTWGKLSSFLDNLGSDVKTYEFDTDKFRIVGHIKKSCGDLNCTWNIVTTKPGRPVGDLLGEPDDFVSQESYQAMLDESE